MKQGFWMHKSALDVCVEVIDTKHVDDDLIEVYGRLWNLGYVGDPIFIDGPNRFKIKKSDLSKWIDISKDVTERRTKSGVPDGSR